MNDKHEPAPQAERRRQLLSRELRSIVPLSLVVILIIVAAFIQPQLLRILGESL